MLQKLAAKVAVHPIVVITSLFVLLLMIACGGPEDTPATPQTLAPADTNLTERPSLLAFRSNRDGNHEIYTMNADGSGLTRLTNDRLRTMRPHGLPTPNGSLSRLTGTAAGRGRRFM